MSVVVDVKIDEFKENVNLNIIYSSSLLYGILSFIVGSIVDPISKIMLILGCIIIILSLSMLVIINTNPDVNRSSLISISIGLLFFFILLNFIVYLFTYTCVYKMSKTTKEIENQAKIVRKTSEEFTKTLYKNIKQANENTQNEAKKQYTKFKKIFKPSSSSDKYRLFLKKNLLEACDLNKTSNFGSNQVDNQDILNLNTILNNFNLKYENIGKWYKQYSYCKPFYYIKVLFIVVYTIAVIEYKMER